MNSVGGGASGSESARFILLLALAAAIVFPLGIWSMTHRSDGSVSLAQLAANQEAYSGQFVRTHGVVRQFEGGYEGIHYVIEDGRTNRVLLRPADVAALYVGKNVTVDGRFEWHTEGGRFIVVERLELST